MRTAWSTLAVLLLLALTMPTGASVKDSLHNLSVSGPGSVKAATADRICQFCHISHSTGSGAALWARGRSTAAYIPYSSSTAVAQPGQPTGSSILCLSCHDGTIALGEILNRGQPHSMAGGNNRMPPGRGLQGTDLSDDHPISFQYTSNLASQNGELVTPATLGSELPLDRNGELQCTTCHDAHDSPYGKLLRMPNIRSQLCVQCHQETGWSQTSHNQSVATWNGSNPNPWHDSPYTTVRSKNWRMVEFHEDGTRELYDLSDDIGESKNLAISKPNIAEDLHQKLKQWRKDIGAQMPLDNPNFDAAKQGATAKRGKKK